MTMHYNLMGFEPMLADETHAECQCRVALSDKHYFNGRQQTAHVDSYLDNLCARASAVLDKMAAERWDAIHKF